MAQSSLASPWRQMAGDTTATESPPLMPRAPKAPTLRPELAVPFSYDWTSERLEAYAAGLDEYLKELGGATGSQRGGRGSIVGIGKRSDAMQDAAYRAAGARALAEKKKGKEKAAATATAKAQADAPYNDYLWRAWRNEQTGKFGATVNPERPPDEELRKWDDERRRPPAKSEPTLADIEAEATARARGTAAGAKTPEQLLAESKARATGSAEGRADAPVRGFEMDREGRVAGGQQLNYLQEEMKEIRAGAERAVEKFLPDKRGEEIEKILRQDGRYQRLLKQKIDLEGKMFGGGESGGGATWTDAEAMAEFMRLYGSLPLTDPKRVAGKAEWKEKIGKPK